MPSIENPFPLNLPRRPALRKGPSALFSLVLTQLLFSSAAVEAQTWPSEPVEFKHNGGNWGYWIPSDAPAGEPLRVIVNMRGAGTGIGRPSGLLDALTERGHHAVVVTNEDSYLEVLAPDLISSLRASPHNLNIHDDIFLMGFSRGGQMTNRILQQLPEGIMGAAPRNPGSVTLPSGKLYGTIGTNQGGWTAEEIGPNFEGTKWTGGPGQVGLGDPAVEDAKSIPVFNVMGIADDSRYPATHFFNMEMQDTFGHPHFNTLWAQGGHGTQRANTLPIVDFLVRLEEHPANTPPTAEIDGPRIVVLNPGTSHTLTATATDLEDDDQDLVYEWRQASMEDHNDFLINDQFSYVRRYIDGVDGYIAMHRNAAIQPDGLSSDDEFEPRAIISSTSSYTFTTPAVEESTPIFLEFKAIDSDGFAHTDSVLVVANGPPHILTGPFNRRRDPIERRSVLQYESTPLRYRALDITSDTLQWDLETNPSHGSLQWESRSGEFAELVYTPDEDYLGGDSFDLRVTDELGLSSTFTVELTVSNDTLVLPAEMNAVREHSTATAGALKDGATMELKTGPYPDWRDLRSAYIRFPLDTLAGDILSSKATVYVNEQTRGEGTDEITVYLLDADTYGTVDELAFGWGIVPPLPGPEAILDTLTVDGPGFYSLDVTAAVEAALAAGERSLTLMFRSDSTNGPVYASRHWPNPNLRPHLDVVTPARELAPPAFRKQPEGIAITEGDPAEFGVDVFGIPFPDLKWQKDGVDLPVSERIPFIDEPTLVIDPVLPSDAGNYRAVATNSQGTSTSDEATLIVNSLPPNIVAGPDDIASVINRTITLRVEAEGSGPLHYTWAFNNTPIADADGPELTVGPLGADNIGTYTVTVTNEGGSDSASAEVTVNLDGNFTFAYDANQGAGRVPDGGEAPDGSSIDVSFYPLPEHPERDFGGWKTAPEGLFAEYRPEGQAAFVLDENVTFYAHWLAPWTPIESFSNMAQGNLNGQNGWTSDASAEVAADPTDAANQVMRFAPDANDEAVKGLFPGIPDQGQSTFFARVYFPDGAQPIKQQLHLPEADNFSLNFDSSRDGQSPESLIHLRYGEQSGSRQTQYPIQRGTWYKLWMLFDYDKNQARVYVQGEMDDSPVHLLVANDPDPGNYFFGAGQIDSMEIVGFDSGPVLWDDLYMLVGESRLDDPRQAGIASPGQAYFDWMDAFASELTPGNREPSANPSGDGIPNLMKYALGLDPRRQADPSVLPQISLEKEEGNPFLTLHTSRNPNSEGVTVWVEYSDNLVEGFTRDNLILLRDNPEELKVRVAHPFNAQNASQFLRLRAESGD